MTKKDIKQIFRNNKVQLGNGTLELIEDHLRREIDAMAKRAKSGNFKRINPDQFHYIKGDWGIPPSPRKLT